MIAFSVSGRTSKLISKQRPFRPIYSFSPSKKVYNRLSLVWGITPLHIPPINDAKRLIEAGEKVMVDKKFIKMNDMVIIITGLALKSGSTNLIRIHRIGQED
jgi:pyruvate kinase